jgi:hypothetical protein
VHVAEQASFFQPPKPCQAIGTGIGTLMPTMPDLHAARELARHVAVAGEAGHAVAELVVVDQLQASRSPGRAHSTAPGRRSLPCRCACRRDVVEQRAAEEEAASRPAPSWPRPSTTRCAFLHAGSM